MRRPSLATARRDGQPHWLCGQTWHRGPLVLNGAPLSYWSGIAGVNPMRYKEDS